MEWSTRTPGCTWTVVTDGVPQEWMIERAHRIAIAQGINRDTLKPRANRSIVRGYRAKDAALPARVQSQWPPT